MKLWQSLILSCWKNLVMVTGWLTKTPFRFESIGTDHALEHENKMTKIGGVEDSLISLKSLKIILLSPTFSWLHLMGYHILPVRKQVNNGATSIKIFALQTHVLVFAIRHYPNLPDGSTMGTGTGAIKLTNNWTETDIQCSIGPCFGCSFWVKWYWKLC